MQKKKKQYGLVVPASRMLDDPPEPIEEQTEESYPNLRYSIPIWGSNCNKNFQYFLEVIKEGKQIESVEFDDEESKMQDKGWLLIGRMPPEEEVPHFTLLHPSVSRQHAIIQMKNNGQMFLYDLGSTHGTFLNKRKVKQRAYIPLRCGDLLRFGQSTRLYHFSSHSERVLENPDEIPEELQPAEPVPQLFTGNYKEMKEYMKQVNKGKPKKKKNQDSSDEEEVLQAVDSDDEVRNQVGDNEYFLGVDDGDDGDDDFFDRTKATTKKFDRSKFSVMTRKSIQKQLQDLDGDVERLKTELNTLKETKDSKPSETEGDELDQFMVGVVDAEKKNKISSLEKELKDKLEEQTKQSRQLQAVSNPLDRMMPLTQKREREPITQEEEPKPKIRTLQKLDEYETPLALPIDPKPTSKTPIDSLPSERLKESLDVDGQATNSEPIIPAASSTDTKKRKTKPKPKSTKAKKPEVVLDSNDPNQYIEWVPPQGQKGDGSTHLNAKFGY